MLVFLCFGFLRFFYGILIFDNNVIINVVNGIKKNGERKSRVIKFMNMNLVYSVFLERPRVEP